MINAANWNNDNSNSDVVDDDDKTNKNWCIGAKRRYVCIQQFQRRMKYTAAAVDITSERTKKNREGNNIKCRYEK